MQTHTQETNRKGQPASAPGACSASWTEYVWNGKAYCEARNIVVRAETEREASLLLEREMESLMPNK